MKEKYQSLIAKNNKIINIITIVKLALFILFLVFFITYFTSDNRTNLYLSLVLLVLFFVVCGLTRKYYLDKKYYNQALDAIAKHESRQSGKVVNQKGFFDKGQEFKRRFSKNSLRDKYLLEDIEVFGKNSLFEHLSSAKSVLGRYKLADSLCHGSEKMFYLKEKTYDLGKKDIHIDLEASLAFNNITQDIDEENYVDMLSQKFTSKKKLHLGLIAIYLLDIILIILTALSTISPLYILIAVVINIYYSSLFKDSLNTLNLTSLYNSIGQTENVLNYLAKLDLTDIDEKYTEEYFKAQLKKVKRMSALWQVLSFKNNIIFKLIFNGLICFEPLYQLIFNKLQLNKDEINEILDDIANLELLCSYANISADYDSCIGEVSDKLEFIDLSNILVTNCIPNSFALNTGTIITGSNMSGKTTFLRTLGEAVLLFNACGIVPAIKFSSPKYMMYTALRVKDDMSLGVSSFYAEIEKIREMVEDTTSTHKLALIDEIFKGTNTLDRVYGAQMLIKKIEELNYDFIISTHDFELCEIPSIVNYHFSEQYTMDYKEISFDYKIKEGKSVSTNAIFLLKKSGIID